MIILKILPSAKKGMHNYYEVIFEENFIEKSVICKEKEIIKEFAIDKKEFKLILRDSIMNEKF